MATDKTWVEGQVSEDPAQERDVEALIAGFLRALLDEQKLCRPVAAEEEISEKTGIEAST